MSSRSTLENQKLFFAFVSLDMGRDVMSSYRNGIAQRTCPAGMGFNKWDIRI